MLKILITEPISEAGMRVLEQRGATPVLCPDALTATAASLAHDVQGIITRNTRIDKSVLDAAPLLKAVAPHGVGFDHVDVEECNRRGIAVCNTPGANAESVAETIVGLMLMLTRHLSRGDRVMREERDYYARHQLIGRDLFGKTILLIGLGNIGRRVARICRYGFEMRVLAVDPALSAEEVAARAAEKRESLGEALPEADFVALACPLNDTTRHMIGADQLAQMKEGAYLVNCARGALVDDVALAAALREGRLTGAAVDVYAVEPPERDDPLFDCPNLLATPHIAANARDSVDNMSRLSAEYVLAVIDGAPEKANIVNREALGL
ncbi:MAG: hydroxyacid dehydrogenase [Clostridia bacterium]|nr:hydroxyacid dehydrogenase [Clostridia bacterium]